MALKPYPAYKDSGLPWLGNVPAHWEVKPNRALFSEVKDQNHPEEPLLSITISRGVIQQSELLSDTSKKDSSNIDKSKYKRVLPGDIAYNKMRAWQGAIGASQSRGIISPAYVVQRPRAGVVAEYMHHLLRTPAFAKEAERWSYGITSDMWNLRPEHFKMIYTCLPPVAEQVAIIRFLDHVDRQIRRYIRAKKNLIKFLEEQKQAIIYRAVTRGLDPNIPLKSSGVVGLGEIPKHWNVSLLGRCVMLVEQGWSPVAAEGGLAEEQWAVLTLSSVRRGIFNPAAIKPVSKDAIVPERIEVRNGDFLLTRSNTRERVGDVCVAESVRPKTILCDLIYRLGINREVIDPKFLMFQLLSPFGRGQIERDARGSSGTMPKISQGHIKSWRVVVPPIEEQRQIVKSVTAALGPIDAATERGQREIYFIGEYRNRLIANVVTGKFDVREAAAKLPDDAEVVEPAEPGEMPAEDEEESKGVELAIPAEDVIS